MVPILALVKIKFPIIINYENVSSKVKITQGKDKTTQYYVLLMNNVFLYLFFHRVTKSYRWLCKLSRLETQMVLATFPFPCLIHVNAEQDNINLSCKKELYSPLSFDASFCSNATLKAGVNDAPSFSTLCLPHHTIQTSL